uniref:Fibrinogen C-terminal domain-containing protein n=1 Tax=Gopherus evgoodei TaxID=1825980 RepID=A0A8C4XYK4_9SAUR
CLSHPLSSLGARTVFHYVFVQHLQQWSTGTVSVGQQINTAEAHNDKLLWMFSLDYGQLFALPRSLFYEAILFCSDCSAVFNSRKTENGYYRIRPRADREPFLVYCDMSDGGGWTVIQRRSNVVSHFRKWADYKQGFGRFQGKNDEYWLGNEHIYDLLVREENSLKIDLMDWHGERRYAIYENFQIKNEQDNYRLWVGTYSGNAGDALGMPFSTSDKDHDRFLAGNCAQENKCGWWFNRCHAANLNGQYYKTGNYTGRHDNGVVWSTWRGLWYSLKYTAMKIRLPSFVDVGSGNGKSS